MQASGGGEVVDGHGVLRLIVQMGLEQGCRQLPGRSPKLAAFGALSQVHWTCSCAIAHRRLTPSSVPCLAPRLLRLIGLAGMRLAIGRTALGQWPQKWNSLAAGSPIGQRHMRSEMVSTVAWLPSSRVSGIFLHHRRRPAWVRTAAPWAPWAGAGARPARGAGAAGQAQPVHLADHGIAGDPAQGAGDLAGRKPFGPKRLELFDPVVRPVCLCHGHRSIDGRGWARGRGSDPPVTRYSIVAIATAQALRGLRHSLVHTKSSPDTAVPPCVRRPVEELAIKSG